MNRRSLKISVITNLIMISLVLMVVSVSFFPDRALPINTDSTIKAIYNGNRNEKNVSLMFNVYENTKVVNSICDELDARGLKATFFVGGCWADDNQETLEKLVRSGHEIANHGYFHKDHAKLSYEKNKEEISLTDTIVKALCGKKMTLFAPPSGSFCQETLICATDLNYKVIMWSKDTIDWRDKDVALIVKRATNKVTNGDLILMHPKEHTLKALPEILDYYEKIGLKQVTVSQNISDI